MNEWTKIFNQVSELKVRSVTDSLFKFGVLCLLFSILCVVLTDKNWVIIIVFCFTGLFFLLGIIFYCYFALKKPDYLRSETYQLKKQAFEILGDNERVNNKNLENLPSIMNPYHRSDDLDDENPLLK